MTREEALETIKAKMDYYESDKRLRAAIETLVPELQENEDERMLRTIIRGFENWKSNGNVTFNNTKVDDILAYLEKQKEQKPAEWSNVVPRTLFREGYEQAEKDLGWHSVKESLPPVGEEVIALCNEAHGTTLPIACYMCFAHLVEDKSIFVEYNGWNIPGVKYWMPCPELPEK